ncbi:MAG: ComF family protein [Gammaproteobacteria bacterium]|nr:ComF family protein [Gammaproteobacteria bacterium]
MISLLCRPTCVFCDSITYRKLDLCMVCEGELPFLKNYCQRCASPLPQGQDICGACLGNSLPAIKTTVLFHYEPPIDKLIMNLKFHNNLIGAKILGELLGDHLYNQYQAEAKPEVIIPMPLHFARLRERGYNQSLEISQPIAKRLKIPIDIFKIKRLKNTVPQSRLNAKERIKNVKHAFHVVGDFNYRHVAIVDDVITTGNTVFELSKLLYAVGATKIEIWCLAKSLFKNSNSQVENPQLAGFLNRLKK